jgi:hypothetical protein
LRQESTKTIVQTCQMISANLGEEKIMGGFGSGRGQRGKDTTSDMRPLDIRRLHRAGLLTPGRAFGWQWSVCGERGGINPDTNGSRPRDSRLPKPKQWRRVATDGIPRQSGMDGLQLGGRRAWFLCPARTDAGGAWRCCYGGSASSPVGTVTSWPMRASGKRMMIERCDGQTPSGGDLDGGPG